MLYIYMYAYTHVYIYIHINICIRRERYKEKHTCASNLDVSQQRLLKNKQEEPEDDDLPSKCEADPYQCDGSGFTHRLRLEVESWVSVLGGFWGSQSKGCSGPLKSQEGLKVRRH